jgi:hypothetical protein
MARRAALRKQRPMARRPLPARGVPNRVTMPRGMARRAKTTAGGTLALFICVLLVVAVLPLCLVVMTGMAPTIAAAVFDRHPRRYLLRAVAVLNLAGMVQPIATLLHLGVTVYGAAQVLFDPYQWLWMYGASALGWLCYLGMPPVMSYVIEGRAARTERELQDRTKALIEEWGEEVDPRKREPMGAAANPAAAPGGRAPLSRGEAGAPSPST